MVRTIGDQIIDCKKPFKHQITAIEPTPPENPIARLHNPEPVMPVAIITCGRTLSPMKPLKSCPAQ